MASLWCAFGQRVHAAMFAMSWESVGRQQFEQECRVGVECGFADGLVDARAPGEDVIEAHRQLENLRAGCCELRAPLPPSPQPSGEVFRAVCPSGSIAGVEVASADRRQRRGVR